MSRVPARAFPSIRGLPRAFWFLWLGTLINRLGGFVVPFLALYLTQERGFTVERAGFTAALFGAGSLVSAPVGGVLADRIGRRATMALGLTLGAAAMLHLGLARSPDHIAVAALLVGFFGELYRPAVWAAVADLVPPADRERAFGLVYWAINLGFSFAAILAGSLAARGYWLLFAGDAITSAGMAAVIFFFVPETRPAAAAARRGSRLLDVTAPFRDGAFLVFAGLSLLTALLFMQHMVALPLDMRASGLSGRAFGLLIAVNGLLIITLQPSVGRLIANRPRSRVLALATLLVGTGFGMTALARSAGGYAASIAVWTFGEMMLLPITPGIVADLAPAELRGTYQGVYQMSWGAAFCLAPAIGALVLGAFGSRTLWLGCLVLGALVAVGQLAIAGQRRRRLNLD